MIEPTAQTSVDISKGPPLPPDATVSLKSLAGNRGGDLGAGVLGSNPAVMSLQALQDVKRGMRILAALNPDKADLLNTTIMQLEQLISTSMADNLSNTLPAPGPPMPPPGPAGAPPGMGPPPGMGM